MLILSIKGFKTTTNDYILPCYKSMYAVDLSKNKYFFCLMQFRVN